MDFEKFVFDPKIDLGRIAILLAMTQDQQMEQDFLNHYRAQGIRGAVTIVAGNDTIARSKVVRMVTSLCVNERIIERKTEHLHPVCHAILEAMQSTRCSDAVDQNYLFKTAVVRYRNRFAICFYGNLGMHELTSHKTIGVGMQILGD